MLNRLYQFPLVRHLCEYVGPSVWRLPRQVRSRLCRERQWPQIKGAAFWQYGYAESVWPRSPALGPPTTLGHRIATQPYRTRTPLVVETPRAWLVGRHATPVTPCGRVLLTPYRDQPAKMAGESQPDLVDWLETLEFQRVDRPRYVGVCNLVSRLDRNYFHWMIESCAHLEALRVYEAWNGQFPTLLIRENSLPFVRESLSLLGVPDHAIQEWREDQAPMYVSKLVLPTLPGVRVGLSPRSLNWLRTEFLSAAGVDPSEPATLDLYLARPRDRWRSIANDDEVTAALESRGFTTLRPESMPLVEQIRTFARARRVVAMHGAGLTNMLFAPRARLLELIGEYGGGDFFSLTSAFDQPHGTLKCRNDGDNLVVDIPQLLDGLHRLDHFDDAPAERSANRERIAVGG